MAPHRLRALVKIVTKNVIKCYEPSILPIFCNLYYKITPVRSSIFYDFSTRLSVKGSENVSKSSTVKPILSSHLKKDKTKVLMENGCLMAV